MEEENKYQFAREIIFNLRACRAITDKVYLHWVDKLIEDENQAKNNESLHDVSEILDYEINSSWIASKVSNKYFRKLLGSYFAWKVRGKHNRYLINKYWKKAINSSR